MKTTMKGLTSYQRKQIVFIATTEQYSEAERVKLLRSLSYCTDNVKFEVLESSEQVGKKQYDRLCDLYFFGRKKQWTYTETVQLIECYNRGLPTVDMMRIFGASKAAINNRIHLMRTHPLFEKLFTIKKYTRRAEAKA